MTEQIPKFIWNSLQPFQPPQIGHKQAHIGTARIKFLQTTMQQWNPVFPTLLCKTKQHKEIYSQNNPIPINTSISHIPLLMLHYCFYNITYICVRCINQKLQEKRKKKAKQRLQVPETKGDRWSRSKQYYPCCWWQKANKHFLNP